MYSRNPPLFLSGFPSPAMFLFASRSIGNVPVIVALGCRLWRATPPSDFAASRSAGSIGECKSCQSMPEKRGGQSCRELVIDPVCALLVSRMELPGRARGRRFFVAPRRVYTKLFIFPCETYLFLYSSKLLLPPC